MTPALPDSINEGASVFFFRYTTVMRRLDLSLTALRVPLDALALLSAAIATYALRYSKAFVDARPLLTTIPFSQYLTTSALFILPWLFIFTIAGLYRPRERRSLTELGRIILACTTGIALVIATVFFRREFATSRFLVLGVWGFTIAFVWIERLALRIVRLLILRARYGHERLVIIGRNAAGNDLALLFDNHPIHGYTIIESFKHWNEQTKKELARLCRNHEIDGLLLADPELPKAQAIDVISFTEDHHLVFRYLADLFAARFTNIEVTAIGGIPVIEVKRTPLDGWGRIIKRLFDVIVSTIALLIASPVILFAEIMVAVQDGFPVIFQNERVGERGVIFNTYKLRSMWKKDCIGPQFADIAGDRLAKEKQLIHERSIKIGPIYKIADDPRVIPIGRWLRRWSLDELPQFWNVIRGEMSLVGPRPHQPREVAGYEPRHRRVLAIKPGITGLAQTSGRSDLAFEDEVRLDIYYIENWSLALDLYILAKTPIAVLTRKGVY